MAERPAPRLTREELARAVRAEPDFIDALVQREMLKPGEDGSFRPSDIQRVRAVQAMLSPGIDLDQLIGAFKAQLFTLQPMDFLYPEPARVVDTTVADLATSLGLDTQELMRVIVAAGAPAPLPDQPMRDDDLALIKLLVEIGSKLGGPKTALRTSRVFGESARRVAETAVAIFDEQVNSPIVRSRPDEATRMAVNRLAGELMVQSEMLFGLLYRRHLEHALLRLWAGSAEQFLDELGIRPARPISPGLAFVDLSGYTRLTERAGDATAARLAERLGETAEFTAARRNGRVVKLLGDGAMLHFDAPLDAVRGALDLVDAIGASDLSLAHGGVNSGPVIHRDGDFFGRTVNIAARISAEAGPGQVLVSPGIVALDASDLAFVSIGERELKGLGETTLYEASWRLSE